jgi:hypothetical protein
MRIPVADPDGELPGIIARLTAQGRALKGITVHRSSLEDVFFRVTGDPDSVAAAPERELVSG